MLFYLFVYLRSQKFWGNFQNRINKQMENWIFWVLILDGEYFFFTY